MSMDFYKKGKWPINTKHVWKIRAVTRATEELHGACRNVRVKIGDVEIDQHFFVQETSSHPVVLGELYITAARIEPRYWTTVQPTRGSKARTGAIQSSS